MSEKERYNRMRSYINNKAKSDVEASELFIFIWNDEYMDRIIRPLLVKKQSLINYIKSIIRKFIHD